MSPRTASKPRAVKATPLVPADEKTQQGGVPLRLLRMNALQQRVPYSKPSIWRLIAAGKFPRPISLGGGRAVAWVEQEIDEYLAQRIAARDATYHSPQQIHSSAAKCKD